MSKTWIVLYFRISVHFQRWIFHFFIVFILVVCACVCVWEAAAPSRTQALRFKNTTIISNTTWHFKKKVSIGSENLEWSTTTPTVRMYVWFFSSFKFYHFLCKQQRRNHLYWEESPAYLRSSLPKAAAPFHTCSPCPLSRPWWFYRSSASGLLMADPTGIMQWTAASSSR